MAKTQLADVFVPDIWEQYFIERTAELTQFNGSGIVGDDGDFGARASADGSLVTMPFWVDLTGARQVMSDTDPFDTKKIGASQDFARIHNDGDAWSTTLLADLLAGSRGMDAIIDLVGQYWARVDEAMLISSVKGVLAAFDAEGGDPNYLKINIETATGVVAANTLNGETFIDAKQKMGDAKNKLTAICMHSLTEADLMKQTLIDFIPDADGRETLPFFQGLRVIVDDDMPLRDGTTDGTNLVKTSVLFGLGAFGRGMAALTTPAEGGFGTEGVERTRVPLNHDSVLINRRRYIMHPRGVKWTETSVAEAGGPTDAELETASNWTRVFEAKNIRMVGVDHNLSSDI